MDAQLRLQQALLRCAQGHEPALRDAYNATSAHLYGLSLRILKDHALAEDCLQNAWVKVWHKAGSYNPEIASPMAWLSTIVRNQALDMLRRQKPEQSLEGSDWLEVEDDSPAHDAVINSKQEAQAVHRCLAELEGDQRRSIELAYFEGLTHAELAERMERPLGTVKSWVLRGLKRLKTCLSA